MGIIAEQQYDVFFSYASLDNRAHSNWVKNFRNDLQERVHVELSERQSTPVDFDRIEFFIDEQGMPANGALADELINAIRKSHFLFMFVGDNYLRSEYCAKELEWFSSRFSSIEKHALNHMFMLMLTREAVRGASKGKLGEIKSKAKYENVFDDQSGKPIDRFLPTEEGILASNPAYTELVVKIAKTLVQRMMDKGVAASAPPAQAGDVIAFGAVTPSLKEYRTALAGEIERAHGVTTDLLELSDLFTPDEVKNRLKRARFFVQLADRSPIGIVGGSQPGGFLALQEQLAGPEPPILWLEPRDSADLTVKETDATHLTYLDHVAPLKLTRAEVVQEIGRRLHGGDDGAAGSARVAKIMLEHSDSDRKQVARVRRIVESAWSKVAPNGLRLRFRAAEWDQMKEAPELLQSYHGIVVVDRSKPFKTLAVQIEAIEDELANHNCELEQRTFVLPPKSKPTLMDWTPIVFQEKNDNPHLVVTTQEELEQFLGSVMNKALATIQSAKTARP